MAFERALPKSLTVRCTYVEIARDIIVPWIEKNIFIADVQVEGRGRNSHYMVHSDLSTTVAF